MHKCIVVILFLSYIYTQNQYQESDFISVEDQNQPYAVCNGDNEYSVDSPWSLADYNGALNGGQYKVLMLDIVATWWAPCQQTIVDGHADEIHQEWANNEHVEIITILDDINCPTSCTGWGDFYQTTEPLIIDDGNDNCSTLGGTIYHLFENPSEIAIGTSGYPIYVFLTHDMKIHKIRYSAPPSIANFYIQQMIDGMDSDLLNNSSEITYIDHFTMNFFYPNPFNPILNINFNIALSDIVFVNIYDIEGAFIESLHSGFLHSGSHELIWNAVNMPSGIYLISINYGSKYYRDKAVLLK